MAESYITRAEIEYLSRELKNQEMQNEINFLTKELRLYQKWCARPKVLKEVIHHKSVPRDSQCLYGCEAYDEYIYE
ncbi:hypothetical protein LCGC14_3046980 [marine sediment metagenome]|uniref:Uncharacterized protein n=1 Tax=marine sediment metagenome TaxID=412755 RepID=A0A0F8XB33_9ZZZZ|nr:hypothetical protein [Candidatus Scalindua sp.]